MAVSLDDIKQLRDMTGAGMSDCKKALESSNGDIEGAIDFLRKLGQKLSVKRADREAKEGVVMAAISDNRNNGVIVKLACETDFVAKNEKFIALAQSFVDIALKNLPADLNEFMSLKYEDITVAEKVAEQTGVVGEKIDLTEYAVITTKGGEGQVLPYIHAGYRAGVLVHLNQEGTDKIDAGKNVAMQVAAMKPIAVNKDQVDATIIEREIDIAKEQIRAEGKPEEMVEKIALGKLNKFFKESTLLNQDYVKDGNMTVTSYLESVSKGLTVIDFKHVSLG
jgi:elongation factor Ts